MRARYRVLPECFFMLDGRIVASAGEEVELDTERASHRQALSEQWGVVVEVGSAEPAELEGDSDYLASGPTKLWSARP